LDDCYCYLSKSAQISEFSSQDFPALKDLQQQLLPNSQDTPDLIKGKREIHNFVIHSSFPLYSLTILGIARLGGISLEQAYTYMGFGGIVIITLAIALFLLNLTDPGSTGLALVSLSLITFKGQGLQSITPSNLTMALGLFMFAHQLYTKGRPGIVFYLLNIVALGFHSTGLVYTGLAVVLGVSLRWPAPWFQLLRSFLPTIVLMALFVLVFSIILKHPFLPYLPGIILHSTNYIQEVGVNFSYLFFDTIGLWLVYHSFPLLLWPSFKGYWYFVILAQVMAGGTWLLSSRVKNGLVSSILRGVAFPVLIPTFCGMILAVILCRGLFEQPPEKQWAAPLTVAVLTGSLVLACFHVVSDFPAVLLDRLTILWSPAMAAVWGRGLLVSLAQPGLGKSRFMVTLADKFSAFSLSPKRWAILVPMFLVFAYAPGLLHRYALMEYVKENRIQRYEIILEPSQPRMVQARSQVDDVILYGNKVVLLFYLTHGAVHRRAVYLPLLPLPAGFQVNLDRVKFMAGLNPYLILGRERIRDEKPWRQEDAWIKYPLVLPTGATLLLHLIPDFQVEALEVFSLPGHLGPPGRNLSITYKGVSDTWQQNLSISLGTWETHTLPARVMGGTLILKNQGKDPIYLAGLRLLPGHRKGFNWPWEGVQRVTFKTPEFHTPYSFTIPREYTFRGRRFSMEMLNDQGASVLWRLRPR
jgi:hypothetical protein